MKFFNTHKEQLKDGVTGGKTETLFKISLK